MEDIRVFSLTGIRRIEVQLGYGVPASACPSTRFDSLVLIYIAVRSPVINNSYTVTNFRVRTWWMVVAHRLTLCMYSQHLTFPG